MALSDKRSYNNADLSPVNVAALKKKCKKVGTVQFKIGGKKIELPVEGFLLTTESGHGFFSVQQINAVVQQKADNSYEAVVPKEAQTAVTALKAYKISRAKSSRSKPTVEIPEGLQKMLQSIPKGYKLVLKGTGYELVKSRARTKKG